MKRNILFFLAGLLAATLGLAAAGELLGYADLTYRLVPRTITITPTTQEIEVSPSEVNVQELTITNNSQKEMRLKVDKEYLEYKVAYPLAWGNYIQPAELTLSANGTATIRVTVTAPKVGTPDDLLKLRVKLTELP